MKDLKDCKVNKYDGLCYGPDGKKYHPKGYEAMGVNQWA
jgi:hypothetical protein